jgi:hypothetical protein
MKFIVASSLMARRLLFLVLKIQKGGFPMKKLVMVGLVVALGLGVGGVAYAWWGGYGGHMMGPGYGGYGYMMGPGYGNYTADPGYGYCGGYTAGIDEGKLLTQKDTESILKDYIGSNPNLKVGEVKDKGTYFEGTIVTKDNSLVAKYGIDKDSGSVRPLN